jgi:hypothetical protein
MVNDAGLEQAVDLSRMSCSLAPVDTEVSMLKWGLYAPVSREKTLIGTLVRS